MHSVAEELIEFWRVLPNSAPYVHPLDIDTLREYPGAFHTEFPPVPYVGNICTANIFLLWANGAYAERTITEFAHPHAISEHIKRIRNPTSWATLHFQRQTAVREILLNGKGAIINAMAYRSRKLTDRLRGIAQKLPSVQFHKRWLQSCLLPNEKLLVVVHRPGLWGLKAEVHTRPNVLFSRAPVSSNLELDLLIKLERYLAS